MRITPGHVVEAASVLMDCEPDMIRGKSRVAYETKVRRMVYNAGRELGLSSTEIGNYVNRDHSTVIQMTNRRPLTHTERLIVDRIKQRAREISIERDARIVDHLHSIVKVR